ncbi:conserved hypothetical protein [Histoplasma capsulatum var. duboisii H88]|uniref:Nucleoporin NUP37 n=1 Tax=Ajellomyces capsulatus (strain H88) TaxID=544711 RepID=F0UQF6_AJEC8|nr:conserved hypothetical protein [Histoplasma capsulatum var. duboisii H88]QSS54100.1 hypothetical protein I7I53_01561 [Histoplasma capsulatum var. duboisii H88]
MSSLSFDPVVRQRGNGWQLSYQLPHRVYDTKAYPIQSSNDSTLIIYGHDLGIRILWRGGRAFKSQQQQPPEQEEPTTNGTRNEDVIMIIDSDEETPAPEAKDFNTQSVEFESEEDELDPSRPFHGILRHIDIQLGVKVLGLAVPTFSSEQLRSTLESYPQIFSNTAVFAAACSDCSIRVFTIPLTPPKNPEDNSSWGLQTFTISTGSIQATPSGVAVTVTARKPGESGNRFKPQSRNRAPKGFADSEPDNAWDLLVAIHSAEGSGTLSIYRIPIAYQPGQLKVSLILPSQPTFPIQQLLLPSPAKTISFNPCQYPSDRHSHLLVSFASGSVKIYSCLTSPSRKPTIDARGSSSDTDLKESDGAWLITLSPEFCRNPVGIPRRKTVVDAAWVLGGKAIMVLLSDGSWGIWDPEGAGPGSKDHTSTSHDQSASFTRGGSLSSFTVSGLISGPASSSKPLIFGPIIDPRSSFTPMTPSTRRVREDTLFKGSPVNTPSTSSTRGRISVTTAKISKDGLPDESILIWHGSQNIRIPSLLSLWRNTTKPTGPFNSSSSCKPIPIGNLNLLGENQNGITQLANTSSTVDKEDSKPVIPDVLITAEHQLVILTPKPSRSGHVISESTVQGNPNASVENDQFMLRRGELDLEGMDRVLSNMAESMRPIDAFRSPPKKRIFS